MRIKQHYATLLGIACIGVVIATSLRSSSHDTASGLNVVRDANRNCYLVQRITHFSQLELALFDDQQNPLGSFKAWQRQLGDRHLAFAMNAGIFHPDYLPVGLYIEQGKTLFALNQGQGWGNFFLQPNGVLAWNDQQAVIVPTSQWKVVDFRSNYATQSGPMLIVDGQINPLFDSASTSKKIRNGVGIHQGVLYLVKSEKAVNFYEFAQFFQHHVNAEHALYLDGSISSVYAPQIRRHDQRFGLGPMIGVIRP